MSNEKNSHKVNVLPKIDDFKPSPFMELIGEVDRQLGLPAMYCMALVKSLEEGRFADVVKFIIGYARNTRTPESVEELVEKSRRNTEARRIVLLEYVGATLDYVRNNGYEIPVSDEEAFAEVCLIVNQRHETADTDAD